MLPKTLTQRWTKYSNGYFNPYLGYNQGQKNKLNSFHNTCKNAHVKIGRVNAAFMLMKFYLETNWQDNVASDRPQFCTLKRENYSATKPGVDFINMYTCSFCACKSQKRKKTDNLTVFFALLGSALVSAAHKMFVNLTLGVNCNYVDKKWRLMQEKDDCIKIRQDNY